MYLLRFLKFGLKRFPYQLGAIAIVMLLAGVCEFTSLFTLAPIVDIMLHPNLEGASPVSLRIARMMEAVGLSVNIWVLFLMFLAFNLAKSAFRAASVLCSLWANTSIFRTLAAETYDTLFASQWTMFASNRQGRFLNSFTRETMQAGLAFQNMGILLSDLSLLFFCIAVALSLSWKVALIGVGTGFILGIPFALLGKKAYSLGKMTTAAANDLVSTLTENISAAKIILGFGKANSSSDRVKEALDSYRKAYVKSNAIRFAVPAFYSPCGIIAVVVSLYAAQVLAVPLSDTAVVLYALWKCIPYVSAITGKKTVIDNSMPSLEQILTTIKDANNLKQTSGSKTFTTFHENILLYKVSFEYPERGPVLKEITVRIPKGRMIGIVGESGSGKSTLIDVVMGFNQPSIGQVTVDGTPLPDYDIVSYRQRLGYVPQDPILFNTSIRENLLWAKPDATQDEIVEACNRANAAEFIDALPEGYDTMIGDRGVRMSGGQCQRLALARAILRKPELLILDEATSSLDTASERLIQQAIDTVARETTVIAVAHRLSTLAHSDYIYVIHEGEVVEEGSPKDLLGKNGAYAKMVYMQSTAAQDS